MRLLEPVYQPGKGHSKMVDGDRWSDSVDCGNCEGILRGSIGYELPANPKTEVMEWALFLYFKEVAGVLVVIREIHA